MRGRVVVWFHIGSFTREKLFGIGPLEGECFIRLQAHDGVHELAKEPVGGG